MWKPGIWYSVSKVYWALKPDPAVSPPGAESESGVVLSLVESKSWKKKNNQKMNADIKRKGSRKRKDEGKTNIFLMRRKQLKENLWREEQGGAPGCELLVGFLCLIIKEYLIMVRAIMKKIVDSEEFCRLNYEEYCTLDGMISTKKVVRMKIVTNEFLHFLFSL